MKRSWVTSILLMVFLQVLVFASLGAADAGDVDSIRLPSDGKYLSDEVMAAIMSVGREMPWKCCNETICNRKIRHLCRCGDIVDKCDSACRRCEQVATDPARYECRDWYEVSHYPVPKCRGHDHDDHPRLRRGKADVVADDADTVRVPDDGKDLSDEVMAAIMSGGKEIPWKCCDETICQRTIPPVCRCNDEVKECDSGCKDCEQVEEDPDIYVCWDWHQVLHPSRVPRCRHHDHPHLRRGKPAVVADDVEGQVMAWMMRSRKNGDEKRPWKCCDHAACTKSIPPICHCFDIVKHCGSGCKECEQVREEGSRYVCMDKYIGDPGPKCGKHAAFGLPGGN